jgi:hypothetical protein
MLTSLRQGYGLAGPPLAIRPSAFASRIPHPAPRIPHLASRIPIGFVFLAILWVLNTVFVIIASIQASDGKFYRYPMTIRFIQ